MKLANKTLAVVLCLFLPQLSQAAEPATQSKGKRFLTDIVVIGGFTGTAVLANPKLREALGRECRISNVLSNFASPIASVREGTRRDTDHFAINYVAHPGSYLAMGLYLKERGYRNETALLFTQIHSVIWEFGIEGSSFPPSGKDLATNFAGAGLGIYLLHPLSRRAEIELRANKGRWYHHIFYWLDPVNALTND